MLIVLLNESNSISKMLFEVLDKVVFFCESIFKTPVVSVALAILKTK
jgi:hypothetical protein